MGYLVTSKSWHESWSLNLQRMFNVINHLMNKLRILFYILKINFSNLWFTNNYKQTFHCDGI